MVSEITEKDQERAGSWIEKELAGYLHPKTARSIQKPLAALLAAVRREAVEAERERCAKKSTALLTILVDRKRIPGDLGGAPFLTIRNEFALAIRPALDDGEEHAARIRAGEAEHGA